MADRPIIFSAPMVQALLAGRKTQTRRILRPSPGMQSKWLTIETLHRAPTCYLAEVDGRLGAQMQHPLAGTAGVDPMSPLTWVRLPYAPGDRLWVREAHALVPASAYRMSEGVAQAVNPEDRDRAAIYRQGFDRCTGGIRWRPSIHMPRWASRLTLHVSEVRVQRLQEISHQDAIHEGIQCQTCAAMHQSACHGKGCPAARATFGTLWNSLHGADAWDANPWVCAISFTVERANIDEARHA